MRQLFFLPVVFACLAACQERKFEHDPQDDVERPAIVVCYEKPRCERMWSAARKWIAKNIEVPIKIDTPALIETGFNGKEVTVSMRREVYFQAGYSEIRADFYCGTQYACAKKRRRLTDEFQLSISRIR